MCLTAICPVSVSGATAHIRTMDRSYNYIVTLYIVHISASLTSTLCIHGEGAYAYFSLLLFHVMHDYVALLLSSVS